MTDWQSYIAKIAAMKDSAALEALEQELFGRKSGLLTLALKELGTLSPDDRKKRGQDLNDWKMRLADAVALRRDELLSASVGALAKADHLDPTIDLPRPARGHLHLIPEFIRTVEDVFGRMGFDVAEGPEIESEELNFTMLNVPEHHPARDMQDTFWIEGSGRDVLRTHTSPVQIRYMKTHKPPFRMICPGRVYRRDADATHSPMFHQFEGLMVGPDISLANMKAVMVEAMRALLSQEIEFRFRTSYFPFVEPGLEVDIRWTTHGDASKSGRWLEVVGCGMVHPNVLRNCDLDPEEWRGFAFGFGVERLLMIKHGIADLRSFYEGDLRFLRQF